MTRQSSVAAVSLPAVLLSGSVTAILVLSLLAVTGAGSAARSDDITATNVLALESWVAFVKGHTPGRRDAPVRGVSHLTLDARRALNGGMPLFLAGLRGQRVQPHSAAERLIVEIARGTEQSVGANAFLKRAAVLHSDAAMASGPHGLDPVEPRGSATVSRVPVSPLLSDRRLLLDSDGELQGEIRANWSWPFARSLLDQVGPRPADDPFVAAWYHATTAYMLANGMYGEVSAHLARAAAILPDDPRILFDRASYLEIQGMPLSQVLLTEADLLVLRARRMGSRNARPAPTSGASLGIPPEEVANEEAETLYRRTLQANPFFVEARVRLGRLLTIRKRYEEATAELTKALEGGQDGIVAFYARLFAGRAAQGSGRLDDAARHYTVATVLFPGAQSARLARSQLALLQADVPAALASIAHLDKSSSASDPWWGYHLALGRDVDALIADMWSQVLKF